ncbi:hypothetical protein IP81_10040 [Novosphingobium sp. AAP83]|uniref:MBG domain-containing protein n=1 Tax=Novosphingobium sp. AAP83 TaxID=1523425 RepID=UPI0006B8DFE7|nr:MBG domain-containing protein [Novosphingobium sp. AAP83]KPF91696.1 hypothetical protein IP81_10040 [Novosphingobium sp. AAP83]
MTNRFLRRSLGLSGSTIAMLAGGQMAPAHAEDVPSTAMPTAGSVVSGSVALPVPTFGNQTVTQTSERAVINWGSFSVGSGQTLTFAQPSVNSATLNRVTGDTTSTIAGTVNATGSVFLINPNGIQITSSGAVNVGRGFVASTLDINDADFMSGQGTFTGNGGLVSNSGTITVTGSGGFVGLLGGQVNHTGLIAAPAGQVTIGAVTKATLDLNGGGFLSIALPDAARVNADGTAALVSTADAQNAVRNIVNLPGSVAAQSASGNNGDVTLSGTVDVSNDAGKGGTIMAIGNAMTANGTLLARATGTTGDGGFIETSGNTVDFAGLTVDTSARGGALGTWLIDPVDITVDEAAAATISNALDTSNVSLLTTVDSASGPGTQSPGSGDININSAISWTGNGELTLTAFNEINFNASITGNNGSLILSARLVNPNSAISVNNFLLQSGTWSQNSAALPGFTVHRDFTIAQNGTAFFNRVLGGDGEAATPLQIADVYGLQGLFDKTSATSIVLANDIDASGTEFWNGGAGFDPLGGETYGSFTGSFDGQGHSITGLTINRENADNIGLFGRVFGGSIRNVDLVNVQVNGRVSVGGLFGHAVFATIENVSTSGQVTGGVSVGGLGGYVYSGSVSNASSSATVTGTQSNYSFGTGGLFGYANGSTISGSHATGSVTGVDAYYTGGLVGFSSAYISNSYATGNVSMYGYGGYVGGLTGYNAGGTIVDSYANGNVEAHNSSGNNAGGLTGINTGTIERAYASGNVSNSGGGFTGGLVADNYGLITDAYATGAVTRANLDLPYAYSGGLVGTNYGTINRTYATGVVAWDGNSAGGLVGNNYGQVENSAWLSGNANGDSSATELTAFEMQDSGFFQGSGWDIANTGGSSSVWRIYEGQTAPLLRSLLTPLTVAANSATVTYNGFAQMVTGYTPSISGASLQGNAVYSGGTGTNAGKYDHSVSGLYSGQQGYDITFVTGALTINQALLTAITYSVADATSTFGTLATLGAVTLSGLASVDIGNVSGTVGLFSGPTEYALSATLGAGTYSQRVTGLTGSAASNYTIASSGNTDGILVVNKLALIGTIAESSSTYGSALAPGAAIFTNIVAGHEVTGNVSIDTTGVLSSSGHLKAGFYNGGYPGGQLVSSLNGASAGNYTFDTVVGAYFVNQKVIGASIASASSIYGSEFIRGSVTLTGLIDGDDVQSGEMELDTEGLTSSSGHLRVGTHTEVQRLLSLAGTDSENYAFNSVLGGDYTVTPKALGGFISTGSSTYGNDFVLGSVTLDGVIGGDFVFGDKVSIDTTGKTSSSGHLRAGSYTGLQSLSSLTGTDADNYSFENVVGDYTVDKLYSDGFVQSLVSVYGDAVRGSEVVLYNVIAGDIVTPETTLINTDHLLSGSGHIRVGSHGIVRVSALGGADGDNYGYAGNDGFYDVTQRVIGGPINVGRSIYGDDLSASEVALTGVLDGDAVFALTSINASDSQVSGANKLKAGYHIGIVNVSGLEGNDAGNYIYQGDAGDYLVEKRALTNGFIGTGFSTYGQLLAVGPAFLDTLSGDQVAGNVSIDTAGNTSTSGNLKAGYHLGIQSVSSIDGADADNYELGRITGDYFVEKALLNGFILPGQTTYGETLVTSPAYLFTEYNYSATNNTFAFDQVYGTVAINTDGLTSSSGNLRAGYHAGIQSVTSISGADADNYDLGVITSDWTVTPKLISASIEAGSSVYGDVLAPGAATLSGLIDGDQVDPANVIVDTSGLTSSSGNLRAGTHTGIQQLANLSGLDAANYIIVPQSGNDTPVTADYTVTAKVVDATIEAGSSVYGEALTPGAVTLNGVVDGDSVGAGNVTIDTTGLTSTSGYLWAALHVGIQRLGDLVGADAGNYSFAGASGDYTVKQRELGGSISAGTSVYGTGRLNPGEVTLTGVLADDVVIGNVRVDTSVSLSSAGRLNAGSYQGIQHIGWFSGADGRNYTAPSVLGDYTVTPKALTANIGTRTAVYGTAFTLPDVALFGILRGDSVSTEVTANDSGLRSSSGNIIAGKHSGFISASSNLSGTDAGNYSFAGASGDYIVTPRALTATIADTTAIYGDSITAGDLTMTGLLDGDIVVTDSVSISSTAGLRSTSGQLRAGTHKNIQQVSSQLSGQDAANYLFRGAAGDVTITPRSITGSLETGTSVYGQRLTPGKLTLNGLLDGDLVSGPIAQVNVTGNTSASGFLNAGEYTGIVSVGSNLGGSDRANYRFAGATGDYQVTQANLNITYTARSANRRYGAADPVFTGVASASGLARGETLADVTTGTATFATDATATTNVGRAGVFGSGLSGNSGNYRFNFGQAANNSTALNITQATLNIVATPLSRRYGSENPLLVYTQTGLVNGDTLTGALATTATQTSNVGRYAITLGTLSAGDNYRIRFNSSVLNVTAATLTYTADPVSRLFGTPNPLLTGTVTGFVLEDTLASATTGTARFSPGTNGLLTPGSYAINGAGLTANNRNYIFVQAAENATALTVTKP